MLKKIFYCFIALLFILLSYFFTTKETSKTPIDNKEQVVESISQIRERQKLEEAIKKIYQEAGEELSIRVEKIINNAKEDIDFIIALKPSQIVAINKQQSITNRIKHHKKTTSKLKYMPLPNFKKYPAGKERKEIFFKYFFYLVESRNQEILKMRKKVIRWKRDKNSITKEDKKTVLYLAKKYEIEDFKIEDNSSWNRLLARLDIVPASLALAQGAKESQWGTSRFARYGYNYYGQRCFSQGCGIVPKKRGNRKFEVKTFSSPRESVKSYIHNINTHFAYENLRKIRSSQRAKGRHIKGLVLVSNLEKYSERGSDYIKELKSFICYNNLFKYDVH